MSVTWALPWAFAGLAALLVPLLLHLDRRRSVQPWSFAALRWVSARARPRRTWRLIDLLLLALRLLLVALLVAWLAQPLLRGAPHAPVHRLAVVPGAEVSDIDLANEEAVWLAPGFPSLRTPRPSGEIPAASLLREIDALLARDDTLEVRVPPVLHGLDDAAIALSREVTWIVADAAAATPAPPVPDPSKPLLALRYASDEEPLLRHVRAALRAWDGVPALAVQVDEASAEEPLPRDADAVLRIGAASQTNGDAPAVLMLDPAGAVPRIGAASQTNDDAPAVLMLDPASAVPRIGAASQTNDRAPAVLTLDPATLSPALLQSAEFPQWLHDALFGASPAPDRAPAGAVAPTATARGIAPPPTPLRPWLAWCVAGLFLLERLVATARRMKAAA